MHHVFCHISVWTKIAFIYATLPNLTTLKASLRFKELHIEMTSVACRRYLVRLINIHERGNLVRCEGFVKLERMHLIGCPQPL